MSHDGQIQRIIIIKLLSRSITMPPVELFPIWTLEIPLNPLRRSSPKASTHGRHNNRTKFAWDDALLEHRHLGDTATNPNPLG